jgi:hypothetical protein
MMEIVLLVIVALVLLYIEGAKQFALEQKQKEEQVPPKEIYVEEHQNRLYAYEKKTDRFLCAFSTYKELHENLVRIDPKVSWVFYHNTKLLVDSFMEKNDGANNPI